MGSASGMDPALAAAVHINGARAGALVAMAPSGAAFDDAQLGMLDAFAEHASLALTDARTVEAMEEAFHDSLTGLPNRALFLDRLQHALDVAARRETDLCVLFVDLDRFKAVNDSIGHAAGDELLRAVAARLSRCTRAADTAARFGGDEFALLLEDDGRGLHPERVAARIIAAMRRSFHVEGKEVYVGATVGIAHAAGAELTPDELLRNADLAMYRAKKAGGNRAATYEGSMRTALLARIELEADLRHALERGELSLAYQPVVELRDRPARRRRGARALDASGPRADPAADLHPRGRGDRAHRRHRALGPARGLPSARRVATARPRAGAQRQPVGAAAARRAPGRRRRAGAARLRAAGVGAHAGDHREHAVVRRRGHRGAPAAPQGASACRSPSTTSAPATRR